MEKQLFLFSGIVIFIIGLSEFSIYTAYISLSRCLICVYLSPFTGSLFSSFTFLMIFFEAQSFFFSFFSEEVQFVYFFLNFVVSMFRGHI